MSCGPQAALVTGAAGGIGAAIVRRLAAAGRHVLALDRSEELLAPLAREVGENVIPMACDLAAPSLANWVDGLVRSYGPITELVNNAGIWFEEPLLEQTDEHWANTFAVNVTASFLLIKHIAPAMITRGGGAIVNIASRNAFVSSVRNAAYDASKAALVALTRTAAGELAPHKIRVNAVCPGVIHTPPNQSLVDNRLFSAAYRKLIPLGRFGLPEEIASVVAFLLSDEAAFITGQTVVVDGGQMACQNNQRLMEITRLGSGGG